MAREAAAQPLAKAAASINEDWGTHYDPKQVQRWAQAAGEALLAQQAAQREAYERGQRPPGPLNDPLLLVIGMDGGRVQGRDQRPAAGGEGGGRWREDKVLTITSYLPGDGHEREPQPLVSTYLATMHDSHEFGVLARLEAERRGIRQAAQVVVIGDGAAWIDTLHREHLGRHARIADWYHALEHLHEAARAAHPDNPPEQERLAGRLESALWDGQALSVSLALEELAARAGPPREEDPPQHPRRVLAQNAGYFRRHAGHMNYPAYRARGWPIGSGVAEAGVKQFNKRVKGTEQFWSEPGVEAILALRALWLSDDGRWDRYWLGQEPRRSAA